MNRLAKWGHWLVAAFLGARGLGLFHWLVIDIPPAWHRLHAATPPRGYVPAAIALCGFYFACAWGILMWRKWAHVSAITLTLLELAIFGLAAAMVGWITPSASNALWLGLNLAVFAWLVLPDVRTSYWQRQQVA